MKRILSGIAVLMAVAFGVSAQAQQLSDQIDGMLSDEVFAMIDGFKSVTADPHIDTANSLERQLEKQKRAIAALERKLDEQGKLLSGIKGTHGSRSVSSSEASSLSRSVSNLERSTSTMVRSLSEQKRKVDNLARTAR